MQRDAKMVSYKVVDKSAKPYVEVDVAGEKKVYLHLLQNEGPSLQSRSAINMPLHCCDAN